MGNVLDHIPFTIKAGASASQAIDIEANGSIVGIIIGANSKWVAAANVALTAYIPDTGRVGYGLDYTDASATYSVLLNEKGIALAWGDQSTDTLEYIMLGISGTLAAPVSTQQIWAVRYVKVNSGTVAT